MWWVTYTIPKPVGRRREPDATRPNWQRKYLSDNNPSTRAPSKRKAKDIDRDKGDLRFDGRNVVGNIVSSCILVGFIETDRHSNNRNNEFANEHAKGTPHQESAASQPLNSDKGEWRSPNIDTVEYQ